MDACIPSLVLCCVQMHWLCIVPTPTTPVPSIGWTMRCNWHPFHRLPIHACVQATCSAHRPPFSPRIPPTEKKLPSGLVPGPGWTSPRWERGPNRNKKNTRFSDFPLPFFLFFFFSFRFVGVGLVATVFRRVASAMDDVGARRGLPQPSRVKDKRPAPRQVRETNVHVQGRDALQRDEGRLTVEHNTHGTMPTSPVDWTTERCRSLPNKSCEMRGRNKKNSPNHRCRK